MKRGTPKLLAFASGVMLMCSQLSTSLADIYPGTNIEWHPGHYLAIHKDAKLSSAYTQAMLRPMIGVNKPYTWKYLEKSKGVYDFTQIENDIALMKSQGKYLIIQVFEKTFANREVALPDYLVNPNNPQYNAAYKGGQTINKQGGYTPKKWIPAVSDRVRALYAALGARFNGRIEAIQITETSTSLPGTLAPADYSHAAYADAIIANMYALKRSFPNTVVQQQVNGMGGGYMPQLIEAAKVGKIGIHTVDTFPNDTRFWDVVYKYYLPFSQARYAPVGALVVHQNFFIGTANEVSAATMANFAINKLGSSYIAWIARDPAKWREILNVITRYKTVLQR